MIILDFIFWWYGPGWLMRLKSFGSQLKSWGQYFSITTLLSTMFSPWHQIVAAKGPDRPLNKIIGDVIDDSISRFVGFWVRVLVLIAGFFTIVILSIFNLAFIIVWPILPIIPAVALVVGVT